MEINNNHRIPWDQVETVLLDMDGTLLDLHFDNAFWRDYLPIRYAERRGLSLTDAKADLFARFQQHEGTLNWYCVDFWSRELDLDIAALKGDLQHLIRLRPYVIEFLEALKAMGKYTALVTNAHPMSVRLKMEKTGLHTYFSQLICAHDLGIPKEKTHFWPQLQQMLPYNPIHTLLIDDNQDILAAAQRYGIAYLYGIAQPDLHLPRTVSSLDRFPKIINFLELISNKLRNSSRMTG